MAVRRECFDALGGFNEAFAVAYNDIDFCLRAQSRGWAVLYVPQAAFHHFESKTRRFEAQQDEADRIERQRAAARLHSLWGTRLTQDPFYNPHFERWAPPFSRLAAPPA
jgi:GT2 family glycosyltransferase